MTKDPNYKYTAAILRVSMEPISDMREGAISTIIEKALGDKYLVVAKDIVNSETYIIKQKLIEYCDYKKVNFVITTGGIGPKLEETTPEATEEIIERHFPGVTEYIRDQNIKNSKIYILSRGVCGTRGHTFILNLPYDEELARDNLKLVLDVIESALDDIMEGEGTR